jgi:RimJ/RimL family protein N-acetyltransferase
MEESVVIETKRLWLRQFKLSDAGFILELLNSPGWLEFIGDRNVRTEDDARTYLSNGPIKSYEMNGFGLLLVLLKDSDIPIGACGLLKRDFLSEPDLGFAFLPDYIGSGYGFESAEAIMNFATRDLHLSHVVAFTVPQNVASIKLLEKLRFTFKEIFKMPEEDEELFLFHYQSTEG